MVIATWQLLHTLGILLLWQCLDSVHCKQVHGKGLTEFSNRSQVQEATRATFGWESCSQASTPDLIVGFWMLTPKVFVTSTKYRNHTLSWFTEFWELELCLCEWPLLHRVDLKGGGRYARLDSTNRWCLIDRALLLYNFDYRNIPPGDVKYEYKMHILALPLLPPHIGSHQSSFITMYQPPSLPGSGCPC